jgi:hypothetical protein
MSNNRPSGQDQQDDMAPEYDFSRGMRGKHAKAMRDGYTMTIHKSDGATEVREVAPRPGTVVLDPDVRAYFPDSEAVNRALRGLISLIPQQHPAQGNSHKRLEALHRDERSASHLASGLHTE